MQFPNEAFQHVIDEACAIRFNPRSPIFYPESLRDRLQRDGATEVLRLADQRMRSMRWGLYRVQRVFSAPAHADRNLTPVMSGSRTDILAQLRVLADRLDLGSEGDGDCQRIWISSRQDSYPHLEDFFVAAPQQALSKVGPGFPAAWKKYWAETSEHDPARELDDRATAAAEALAAAA
ncbi:hypothetical protein [Amycolatopsis anabasis]|uniref:hypothetical protein n=1 Tax=Amycolatopsis anabasis TaxID=1840409 RepID=UPI00131ACF79|nr:hypothetical protein [Amycolatopsis anabasis]